MPDVVTCLIIDEKGRLLILKRSDKVRTYKGLWGGIAGYVEEGEKPINTAYKEIFEELGLKKEDVKLLNNISPIKFTDTYENKSYNWTIFPFLFNTYKKDKVQIDWEHTNYKWILPKDVEKFNTVPHFLDVVLKSIK
jgi:8-oxo-dGTP pyrophosphatase MutT (NUDIX family)